MSLSPTHALKMETDRSFLLAVLGRETLSCESPYKNKQLKWERDIKLVGNQCLWYKVFRHPGFGART